MSVPFQVRCKPLVLQCLHAFILLCFITLMFLLLHSLDKTSITSLGFLLRWSFRDVSSDIITLFISVFIDFTRLMMFSAIVIGSVSVFKSFLHQCKMALLRACPIFG